ncbi:MAG: adenylyltransferase/cytidyltransferase family protein [Candidatus Thorarchaeota archaeon]
MNSLKESKSLFDSLRSLFLLQIELGGASTRDMAKRFDRNESDAKKELEELVSCGLAYRLESRPSQTSSSVDSLTEYVLSEEGRKRLKVVVTTGVFDLLHVGHLATLEASRTLGNVLLVIIARDITVQKRKGRSPINSEKDRQKLVDALKPVDAAYLGHTSDYLRIIHRIHPDLIALGKDQNFDISELRRTLDERGLQDVQVVRLDLELEGIHSSILIEKLQKSRQNAP